MSIDACAMQVTDQLFKDGVLVKTQGAKTVQPLIVPMAADQKDEYEDLEVLDVDVEQAEYLQTIA